MGNTRAIDILANQALAERSSRETWQNQHAPTLTQYVDVQTGAGAFSGSTANAAAVAAALNNGGINRLRLNPRKTFHDCTHSGDDFLN